MRAFPSEFAELLAPRGRRILDGKLPELRGVLANPSRYFVALQNVLDAKKAAGCLALLEKALLGTLVEMEDPIPEEAISGMVENYSELLPKTVRVLTAPLEHRRQRSWRAAEEVGLVAMLQSESFGRFAAALAGRPLRRRWGMQVLCYAHGDYSGPHNDHHPEEPEARDGYLDVHLTFATGAVEHQWLVYARDGHFSEMRSVNTVGGVTAYRLPFWHYTTPLQARAGAEADARRWVLLGTFLFGSPRARAASVVAPP
ncbi:MAG TPA: hypothetical protein VK447_17745 [Myxococcaceae bacterium]|nr:hypothetical protein [Myxococcaceae bacterium]